MIDPTDLAACREAIRHGSRSFHTASKLLPGRVRDPALALYAFCRLADDAVDLNDDKAAAVLRLRDRLELAYAGRPRNAPADRAFADMIAQMAMPRALPEALLEGLAWDAMERRCDSLSALRAYSARVASAVGAMMCVLMGVRGRDALARACDLGVAMQLTNIARDVGEDARAGRLYLPLDWLGEAGIDPDRFLADPLPDPKICDLTRRLLAEAGRLYRRAETGIAALPLRCRPGIFAASRIYAAIGTDLARAGHDSITRRAHTSTAQKLVLLSGAGLRAATSAVTPRSAVIHAAPLPETRFLVEAAAEDAEAPHWGSGRAGTLLSVFAQLEAHERLQKGHHQPS
ncbi:MAG: phytoene/squalene synthase family protein [Pseudomonadota bacterium]